MKVICIEDSWHAAGDDAITPDIPFGKILTVIDYNKDEDGEWYEFAEYPDFEYDVNGFAPLSSIDETEFSRNYKKELV